MVRGPSKRSRRQPEPDSTTSEELEEANLEAEHEDLDEEAVATDDTDWSRPPNVRFSKASASKLHLCTSLLRKCKKQSLRASDESCR